MSPDTFEIAKAISSLQNETNYFKDYIFPFLSTSGSVVAGYFIASYSFKSQEKTKAEIDKVNKLNEFFISIDGGLQTLIAIKSIYSGRINSDPVQRALSIPRIECHISEPPDPKTIVFLTKGNEQVSGEPYYSSWNNLPRINAMVGNYAHLCNRISARNNFKTEIDHFLEYSENGEGFINFEKLTNKDWRVFRQLVDSTESVITLVDGLLKEYYSFLINMHTAASKSINKKLIKGHVELLSYSNNSEMFRSQLDPCPPVDVDSLAHILKITKENASEVYITGYENVPVEHEPALQTKIAK